MGHHGIGNMEMDTFNKGYNKQSNMTAKIIQFNREQFKKPDQEFTASDMQVFDAVELLLEYAHEARLDINQIIDTRELGEVIKALHIFFSKMNGVDQEQIDWEQNIDISNLYNDNGFLASLDKDQD